MSGFLQDDKVDLDSVTKKLEGLDAMAPVLAGEPVQE